MWFLLAVLFLVIYYVMKGIESYQTAPYEIMAARNKKVSEDFNNIFVDEYLENQLENFLIDERREDQIWREVSKAFSEMEHWKNIQKSDLFGPIYYKNQTELKAKQDERYELKMVALDIMLANRGKIRDWKASFGYDTNFYPGYNKASEFKKIQTFEFVKWLEKKLKSQGLPAKMMLHAIVHMDRYTRDSKYVWEGSWASLHVSKQFGEKLIDLDRGILGAQKNRASNTIISTNSSKLIERSKTEKMADSELRSCILSWIEEEDDVRDVVLVNPDTKENEFAECFSSWISNNE